MAPPKTSPPPEPTSDAPELNSVAKATIEVTTADLASSLVPQDGSYPLPAVFATSRMIALMEIAAGKLLIPILPEGHMSVGVDVDITHSAATPNGATVTASAKYIGRRKRLYEFEVVAHDAGGECGRGLHRRAIVDMARLQGTMDKRMAAGAGRSTL